jgi:hypothetical protein
MCFVLPAAKAIIAINLEYLCNSFFTQLANSESNRFLLIIVVIYQSHIYYISLLNLNHALSIEEDVSVIPRASCVYPQEKPRDTLSLRPML